MSNLNYHISLKTFIIFVSVGFCLTSFAQTEWESKYNRYNNLVNERYYEPVENQRQLEPYLKWMDLKAKDRDEIDKILDELNRLSFANPSDPELQKWTQEFFNLQERAQQSGNNTAEGGAILLLRIKPDDDYINTLWELKNKGHPLYLKAKETRFSTYMIRGRAQCMLNFIIGDIECSDNMGGLYIDCDIRFGFINENGYHEIPNRDFDVLCEPRSEFVKYAQGKHNRTTEWAFKWMADIRNEARWWEFPREEADAESLMSQYNEETLCKNPPNDLKKGHKFYVDLAEKNEFDECITYNKGFYGTLYGKVEVLQEGKKLDAPFAIVTVKDLSQTWMVTADKHGNYEIKNVILHKECGPFDISAVFDGERVDEKYEGILVKPDTTARQKKDLLIKSNKKFSWSGSLTMSVQEKYSCSKHEENEHGLIKELTESMSDIKTAAFSIWSGDFTIQPMGLAMQYSDDFGANGLASAVFAEDSRMKWERTRGACPGSFSYRTATSEGTASCMLSQDNLVVTLARNMSAVNNIAQQMQNINPNDLANMQKQLEAMMKQTDETDTELDVVVQVSAMCLGKVTNVVTTGENNTCQGEKEPETKIGSGEVPLIHTFQFHLKGAYTKGKRGDDIIFATFSNKRFASNGKGKGDFATECPEIEIIENCTLNLARRPDN